MEAGKVVLVLARDLLMRARLEDAARAAGFDLGGAADDAPPGLVVADLEGPGALEAAIGWRQREVRVVGFLSHVDRDRWERAEAAGIEVYPRGASATKAGEIIGAAGGR